MVNRRYYKKLGGFAYLFGELNKKIGKQQTDILIDDRIYGNMCGIAFERHGTIGRGSDKCDFYFC